MPHQFRLGGRARGEIEQHRIVGRVGPSGAKGSGEVRRVLERQPAVVRGLLRRPRCGPVCRRRGLEFRDLVLRGHHYFGPAAIEPITQLSGVSNVVAGITTTPSFIAASMVSHSGTTLPSSSNK